MSGCQDCLGCGLQELPSGAIALKVDPAGALKVDPTDPAVDPAASGLYIDLDPTSVVPLSYAPEQFTVVHDEMVTRVDLGGGLFLLPTLSGGYYRTPLNVAASGTLVLNVDGVGAYTTPASVVAPALPAGRGGLFLVAVTMLVDYFGSSTHFNPNQFVQFDQAVSAPGGFINPTGLETETVGASTYYQNRVHASAVLSIPAGKWFRAEFGSTQNHRIQELTIRTSRLRD